MQVSSNPSSRLPEEITPCDHMINLVSRRSDNTLKGPAKLYTDFHVMTCPHCRAALEGLRALQESVARLAKDPSGGLLELKPEDWQNVEKAWSKG